MATDTRNRILQTALRLFNEQGLHVVGVRDIARELGISVGNLGYYFPQKDVLVTALVKELHAANTQRAVGVHRDTATLLTLYRALAGAMRNHLAYRFYQLSYADVLRGSAELQAHEASLDAGRRARTEGMLKQLVEAGLLDGDRLMPALDRLHETLQLVMTSWLRAATVYRADQPDEANVRHYAKLAIGLFEPYCTASGAAEMGVILAGELDEQAFDGSPARH